jgi:Sulfite exporter TauE/SafE
MGMMGMIGLRLARRAHIPTDPQNRQINCSKNAMVAAVGRQRTPSIPRRTDEYDEDKMMMKERITSRFWNWILIVLSLSATCALLITLAAIAQAHASEVLVTNQQQQHSTKSTFPAAATSRLHSYLREYWNERRRRHLDDGAQQQQQQQDEGGNDGQNNNNDKQQQQNNNNFYFDDYIQDDLVQTRDDDDDHSSSSYSHMDDFYAFEVDRTPHLLPLSSNTIFGFFIASLALSLGASSGTGGGGTITPIYILIIGLPIQVAVPIGAVTVLGGSMACTSLNWRRRHPLADRVLIDWDLILVMEPLTLVGALVGSLLHKILSEKILVVLLVLLLSITAHTTLSKAMRMYHAENRYIRHLRKTYGNKSTSMDHHHHHPNNNDTGSASSPTPTPKTPTYPKIQTWGTMDPAEAESLASDSHRDRSSTTLLSDQCSQRTLLVNNQNNNEDTKQQGVSKQPTRTASNGATTTGGKNNNNNTTDPSPSQRQRETAKTRRLRDSEKEEILIENPDYITLRSELMEQAKFTPSGKIMALCGMFFIIIFLSLMVGGGKYESPWEIRCGSTAFWVVHVIMIAVLIGSAWAAQTYVVARHEIKEIVRFDYVHGDIKWDTRRAIIYPALFVSAGFFAGTLGIGGGGTLLFSPSASRENQNCGCSSLSLSCFIVFFCHPHNDRRLCVCFREPQ